MKYLILIILFISCTNNKIYQTEKELGWVVYHLIQCDKGEEIISESIYSAFERNGDIKYSKNGDLKVINGERCTIKDVYTVDITTSSIKCGKHFYENFLYTKKEEDKFKIVYKDEVIEREDCDIKKSKTSSLEAKVIMDNMTREERKNEAIKRAAEAMPTVIM